MKIQPPNREVPDRLRERYNQLTIEGLLSLYAGKYEDAERFFSEQYKLLFEAQDKENRPIHKGLSLHNKGLALYALGRQEEGIHNILLAYIEDTLNVGYDLEDDADRAQAARILRDLFYFRLRILREIKTVSREIKASGKWNAARDPEIILCEVSRRLDFDPSKLVDQCERPLPKVGKMLLGFPQPRERRVFIGTNYYVNPGIIPIAEEAVFRKGYTPIVVAKVGIRPEAIHDESLLLLHTCKYAVIDITHPGGQFMEIERAHDYKVEVLLVRQALDISKPPRISEMISTLGYKIKYYSDPRELVSIIEEFLP